MAETPELDLEQCPQCGKWSRQGTVIRHGRLFGWLIADFGYKCPQCGHEWGFEVLTDPPEPS